MSPVKVLECHVGNKIQRVRLGNKELSSNDVLDTMKKGACSAALAAMGSKGVELTKSLEQGLTRDEKIARICKCKVVDMTIAEERAFAPVAAGSPRKSCRS